MPIFAVDWDGTCVENKYPEKGDWLPGAVDALYLFDRLGQVIIHSVRVAPYKPFTPNNELPLPGTEEPFVNGEHLEEYNYIRGMLDDAGLSHVEIWQRPYKPPAAVYIDDRAVRFEGDWNDTIEEVLEKIQPTVRR